MKSLRSVRSTLTFAFGAADTEKVAVFNFFGYLEVLKVVIPNFTNSPTLTATIKDAAGYTIKTQGTLAKNGERDVTVGRWIPSGCTLTLTLTGAPGGTGGNVVAVGYGESADM